MEFLGVKDGPSWRKIERLLLFGGKDLTRFLNHRISKLKERPLE